MKDSIKIKLTALIVLIGFCLSACIEEPPEIGEPFDKVNNLSGTWSLTSVVQNDEVAISKGFPTYVQTVDLTERVGFGDYQLVLSTSNGEPSSFTEVTGTSPSILGVSEGSWSLDDPDTPTTVTFESGTESTVLEIATYVGITEGLLTLKITKTIGGTPTLSYVYNFEKITN